MENNNASENLPAKETLEPEKPATLFIKVRSTERDCPRCHFVLFLNENEQCYECHNCGYIDCGDDN